MRYIPHTDKEIEAMLSQTGAASLEDLVSSIPPEIRKKASINLPPGIPEQELTEIMKNLASSNATADSFSSFLGGGAYRHFSPSVINHMLLRSEFYTAYTPYQAEISQGTLQAMFEYQSFISMLTGMDVANASMYEGASASAEACLMASRITGRKEIAISECLNPQYRDTAGTYLRAKWEASKTLSLSATGATDVKRATGIISQSTAAILVQQPNFFGVIEPLEELAATAHSAGALLIVAVAEPISLGILKPPGETGADIVCGEGQGLGISLSYGGPYLGFFATKQEFMRNMPGRLVGETVDTNGRRGFVLTIATREQHIRREKATSNICTNEGLCALAASVYMSLMGRRGMMELARENLALAVYAKNLLSGIKGVRFTYDGPVFNEFVYETPLPSGTLLQRLEKRNILGGVPLSRFYPGREREILGCVTEMNSRGEIEKLAQAIGTELGSGSR